MQTHMHTSLAANNWLFQGRFSADVLPSHVAAWSITTMSIQHPERVENHQIPQCFTFLARKKHEQKTNVCLLVNCPKRGMLSSEP